MLRADTCEAVRSAVDAGEMELHAIARNNYPGQLFRADEVPGLSVFGFWKTSGKQHFGLPPHQNEGIEFTMAMQGEIRIAVEGKPYVLRPNELMITRPWQEHAIGTPTFSQGKIGWIILDVGVRHPHQEWTWPEWIILTRQELRMLTRSLRQNEDAIRRVSSEFVHAFSHLVALAKNPKMPHRASRIALQVNFMLLELFMLFESDPVICKASLTDSARTIRLFLGQLKKRLKEPWTLVGMAEACGIGTTRFATQFAALTGETPAKYLMRLRLEAAVQLLKKPEYSIQMIARAVGFTTANYFIRVFAQNYHRTPAKYRTAR